MIQKQFADNVTAIVKDDPEVLGLCVGGSWISNELDEFSDLDLVLVTSEQISGNTESMIAFAKQFGQLINAFTGEHVGEPRLLICLYKDPLLHVDIKFLTLEEFSDRIQNPIILFERDHQLSKIIDSTDAKWPMPDYQWIEDRFWTWVHYIATKLGRGEYFECLDGLGFLRTKVFAPLLAIKNRFNPNALRRLESRLNEEDLETLKGTVAAYDKESIIGALDNAIALYRKLRNELYSSEILIRTEAEEMSLGYWKKITS